MDEELRGAYKSSGYTVSEMIRLIMGSWEPEDRKDFVKRNPYLAIRYLKNLTPEEEQSIFLSMLEK